VHIFVWRRPELRSYGREVLKSLSQGKVRDNLLRNVFREAECLF
jgi:hypothetical protein